MTTLIAILSIALGWYIGNTGICYVGIGMLIGVIYNHELTKLRKKGGN
jgi:4-hydroxybenzoate polyprenyltransferase